MEDAKLLAKLNELRTLDGKEAEDFLRLFIEDVKMDIADENDTNIGFGSSSAVIRKWIEAKRKKDLDTAGFLASSRRNWCVLDMPGFTVVSTAGHADFPLRRGSEAKADELIRRVLEAEKLCHDLFYWPRLSVLKTQLAYQKALPKEERPKVYVYEYADSNFPLMPMIELRQLFIGDQSAYVNDALGERSPMYLKWDFFRGVLYPIA